MTCSGGVVYESLFDQMYWAVQSPCNAQWYAASLCSFTVFSSGFARDCAVSVKARGLHSLAGRRGVRVGDARG
jgi:hypothetical protein